jgi:alanyl-tRNA synthetase
MKSSEVRKKFLGYFEKNGHRVVESSRLVPDNDPTILFTNAGMNQFKNTFLGLERRDYSRAATTQKCVRAGGKHNDLENVGFTARHHTFFEMLGNFSFGDYFKKEAIHYAWNFATKEIGLPKDRLYVSVFEKDDEAADIWHKQEGVPKERIYRFGEKDNFWRMGNSGPCGPCSEIFYDLGPEVGGDPKLNVMGGDGDRFIEFWNLVFMQFNEDESGRQTPLPKPSVDTGMGLERLTTILQGELNNYHTDLFRRLLETSERLSGASYVKDLKAGSTSTIQHQQKINVAMRVLADHARATAFLLADGVLPSNDGRGYVLRRIMRRAIRYGQDLRKDTSFLPNVVSAVIDEMGDYFGELRDQRDLILSHTKDEEKRFLQTLDQGSHLLMAEIGKIQSTGGKTLSGQMAFKLYDTFGFPLDLTSLMAREQGLTVDEATFQSELERTREVARSSWKGRGVSGSEAHLIPLTQKILNEKGPTEFTGYLGVIKGSGEILALSDGQKEVTKLETGQTGIVMCDRTCFYAEGGGQVGDVGALVTSKGHAEVLDTTKINDVILHHVQVTDGELHLGSSSQSEAVQQLVDEAHRRNTAAHHSATHLLHAALRRVLGSHVTQAGSLVGPDKLRFDFTHNAPLSEQEIAAIEALVNGEIAKASEVETHIMTPTEAKSAGALALFGEKYGDKVRVLRMGPFSMELCGGTHVAQTDAIRMFKVVYEAGVSSGVRRIEALTADAALRYLLKNTSENQRARVAVGLQESWTQYLQSTAEPLQWIEKSKDDKRQLEKQLRAAKGSTFDFSKFVAAARPVQIKTTSAQVLITRLPVDDRQVLSDLAEKARSQMGSSIVILVAEGVTPHPVVVAVSKDLSSQAPAGKILGEFATALGGRGGGRPDFAQGAVPGLLDWSKAEQAVLDWLAK